MDIGNVAATTSQTTAKKSLSGNFDTFLRLLTTQLQNQDPLEPMDATKFTDQLVSYSQVEQQINTNANLNSLISMTRSAAGANAVGYLGKTAFTNGNTSSLDGGAASWRYTLSTDANTLQLSIKDESGRVVRTMTGDKNTGAHDFTWDGRNDAGATLPKGVYSLTVTARKADGTAIATPTFGVGMIKEIDMSGAQPLLLIGTRSVTLADILGFKN